MLIKQGKTNWKYILIIAILAAVVGGGVLVWQYLAAPKEEDETADWKTYRNEEYGFKVKYPEDNLLSDEARTEDSLELLFDGGYSLQVTVTSTTAQSVREFSWLNSQQTTLGPYEALESLPDTPPFNSRTYSLIHERKLYQLYGQIYAEGEMTRLNQILSTFRFLEDIKKSPIRNFDFGTYFTALPQYQLCEEFKQEDIYPDYKGIFIRHIEYYDLTNNGSEEAIISARSCWAGTGGNDIFGIFAVSEGGIIELPVNNEGFVRDGLRGKMYFEIRYGKLIQIFPVFSASDPNCCSTGGIREFIYEWNGKEFVISKVQDIPQSIIEWQIYRNRELGFEIKYPDKWIIIDEPGRPLEFKDENGDVVLSASSGNRAVLGISFCAAYPQNEKCEILEPFIIDWGLNREAVAETDVKDGTVALFITLHKVTNDTKVLFRQILSTFRFVE